MSALALQTPAMSGGLIRAARLLKAMGAGASGIWSHLSPDEAATLTGAMAHVTDETPHSADRDAHAFLSDTAKAKAAPTGSASIWPKLAALDEAQLAGLVGNQHPQLAAQILSSLNPDAAARCLRALARPLAMDILRRMLNLRAPSPQVKSTLEAALHAALDSADISSKRDGHERVARIFDQFDSRSEQVFLAAIEDAQPGSGEHIRALMFTFDDLAGLSAGAMQTLLAGCDRGALTLALKGAKPATADAFFANMTSRAADFLRDDISVTGAVRRSEVEAARAEIVAFARTMIQRGDINPTDAADDELVE